MTHTETFMGGVAGFDEAIQRRACPYLNELGEVALGEMRAVYEQIDAGNFDALGDIAERLASAVEQRQQTQTDEKPAFEHADIKPSTERLEPPDIQPEATLHERVYHETAERSEPQEAEPIADMPIAKQGVRPEPRISEGVLREAEIAEITRLLTPEQPAPETYASEPEVVPTAIAEPVIKQPLAEQVVTAEPTLPELPEIPEPVTVVEAAVEAEPESKPIAFEEAVPLEVEQQAEDEPVVLTEEPLALMSEDEVEADYYEVDVLGESELVTDDVAEPSELSWLQVENVMPSPIELPSDSLEPSAVAEAITTNSEPAMEVVEQPSTEEGPLAALPEVLNPYLEVLEPRQREVAEEMIEAMMALVEEKQSLPAESVSEKVAIEKRLATLCVELCEQLGIEYSEQSIEWLNKNGTHEYKPIEGASVLRQLQRLLTQKLPAHLTLGKYTIQACLI